MVIRLPYFLHFYRNRFNQFNKIRNVKYRFRLFNKNILIFLWKQKKLKQIEILEIFTRK